MVCISEASDLLRRRGTARCVSIAGRCGIASFVDDPSSERYDATIGRLRKRAADYELLSASRTGAVVRQVITQELDLKCDLPKPGTIVLRRRGSSR